VASRVADEISLKLSTASAGLLMMVPDCGTAIIAGTPLGFANAVPPRDAGIIAASGPGCRK
jgi:succinyl-CoA synthetase alpha subunit